MDSAKDYKPIDCNYYDRLEAWATTKTVSSIVYRDEAGEQKSLSGKIVDVYTQDKVEYLKTDTGKVIRLDALISVNDVPVPGK
jgi:Rho-binding antiterminator